MLIIVENLQKMHFKKAKLVKVEKCWNMLNVRNINKNVEMLKNVDTKSKYFDADNFFFDKEFKKSLLTHFFTNIYSHL